jgi:hypothetical protein
MNYARTQWKLTLLWQGFFFFGRLDARPCLSAPTRHYASAGYLLPPRFETWPAFSSICRTLALSRAGRPRIILILAIACGCNCCNLIAPLGADTAKEGAQLHAAAASLLQMRGVLAASTP